MQIGNFRHKGLKYLYEDNNEKGVEAGIVDKLRKLLYGLETAGSIDEVEQFPGWRLHPLKGNLRGYWSLTVTGNWRLMFRYDAATNTASNIDLIDYH